MLCKFWRVSDRSLSGLAARSLHAQHFTRFNDPFECGARFLAGQINREAEPERFAAMVRAWGFDDLAQAPLEGTEEYFEQFETHDLGFSLPGLRICCFASEPDNLLMWSHYGDGLRGFCVEFDEAAVTEVIGGLEGFPFITDVAYADEPPSVDGMVLGVLDDQIDYAWMCWHEEKNDFWMGEAERLTEEIRELYRRAFATKPQVWSYEKERRLIVQTDQRDLEPLTVILPPEAVLSVTLGELMPEADREAVQKIVAATYPQAALRTARRIQGAYTLVMD